MVKAALKKGYQLLPFKKNVFDVLKAVYVPSKDVTKHLHFQGDFKVKVKPGAAFKMQSMGYQIENELYWHGLYDGWERYSQKLWAQLCEKAEIIVDIGANNGLYSLVARTVNSECTIYAAEPLEFILKNFEYNLGINHMDDIHVLRLAFSDYNGEGVVYLPKDAEYIRSAAVNTNLLNREAARIDKVTIQTQTLESFIEQTGIEKIDLIKVDVESHEPAVLKGMGPYLERFKPAILAEVSYDGVGEKLNAILDGMGYLYFNIDENKGVRLEEKLSYSDSDNYLICTEEQARSIQLL
ncbi:MAG: FkbM family methyltransferase [Salibacteraceae bacterium]